MPASSSRPLILKRHHHAGLMLAYFSSIPVFSRRFWLHVHGIPWRHPPPLHLCSVRGVDAVSSNVQCPHPCLFFSF